MPGNPVVAAICATAFAIFSMEIALAGDETTPDTAPGSKKCEVAVVNPVSGYAECVKPRGAPVDQPPPRPAPTPDECLKHPDLDLEACKQKQPPQTGREQGPGQ